MLMWLNRSVATTNYTLWLLNIKISIITAGGRASGPFQSHAENVGLPTLEEWAQPEDKVITKDLMLEPMIPIHH